MSLETSPLTIADRTFDSRLLLGTGKFASPEAMRDALAANSARVIDLFREWDDDGDGQVTKKEFRKAMNQFGLDAHRKEVEALFDSWDPDGSGSIEYKELNKLLRRAGA